MLYLEVLSLNAPTCSSVTDNDFLGLHVRLAAGVPDRQIGLHELCEEVYVSDGQTQCVHLRQSLLVGQGGDVGAQPLKRVIDGLHPSPLPDVGRLPQLLHLHLRPHAPPALQQRPSVKAAHLRGQVRSAVCAAVREGGGRGRERQAADVIVAIVRRSSAAAVLAVIVLEMAGEEIDVVIQKVIRVQVSVSRGLVSEKLVIVKVRRGGEGVQSGERVQHTVHLCLAVSECCCCGNNDTLFLLLLTCCSVVTAHGQHLLLVQETAREVSL